MKAKRVLMALLVLVVVVCAALILWPRSGAGEGVVARITVGEALVREVALDELNEPIAFPIEGIGDGYNMVEAERGRIRISHADCPDQTCVRQGWIADGGLPLVCLPHQVIIQIVGREDGVDVTAK